MKIHSIAAGLLLAAGLLVTAAEQFQVAFLPNQNEPRVNKAVRGDAVAELFAGRLAKCFRRPVKVVPFDQANAETVFLIASADTIGGEYAKLLEGKPGDSFIIRYPATVKGKKVCLLMSRDPWGYSYPANWFLRTQIGFDILGPGPDGLVIPDQSKWKIPAKIDIVEIPSFNTRRWTMSKFVDKQFQLMAMGESGRNISWHALGRVILPSKYGKTHPEYFPLVKGKRYTNPRKQLCDWTPCLGNPDVQRICAEYLLKQKSSYGSDAASLAVNDGGGNMCECELCKALDEPGGVTPSNYSNRFFRFYGKVLDLARQKDPNAKTIILLYHVNTSKVPSHAKIHPGIIGMGTNPVNFDNFAAHGLKQMGLWDHQFDYRYPLISHYPKKVAANLRHLYKIGLREYFGEIYMIHAANGPKQYIIGRLLWNIDSDVDQVMTEYCNKAFGKEAGPYVKAYYDLWEQIDDRMRARTEKEKTTTDPAAKEVPAGSRLHSWAPSPPFHINAYRGLDQGDTDKLAALLKKAAAAKMTDIERRRLKIVSNYFEYVRCMADRYLIAERLRSDKKLTIGQIRDLGDRAAALDKKFQQIWTDLISKDDLCIYRYVTAARDPKKPPRLNYIFNNFRDVVSAYLYESVEIALKNLEDRECKGMKRREKVQFWEKMRKECPGMTQIALRLNDISGKPAQNMIKNGTFKKFKSPGNPDVPGAHPELEDWYFYEQVGSVRTDEYKTRWGLVQAKAANNHLRIGEGKYPEIRQYVYLPAGVYRFSANCLAFRNSINFSLYQVPNFDPAALKDLELLRKQRFRTPELISFSCKPAPGNLTVKQVITIPTDSWYALLISMNNQPKHAWNRLWGVKLEKLP
ncbi:MAG: DUF4838 domain-containing protein [Lentisphaeria bacterium]|nr:DUF4838 domain-containing protein [Lentisphaeria bacterium]